MVNSSLQAKRGSPGRPETKFCIKSEVSVVFYVRSYPNQSAVYLQVYLKKSNLGTMSKVNATYFEATRYGTDGGQEH